MSRRIEVATIALLITSCSGQQTTQGAPPAPQSTAGTAAAAVSAADSGMPKPATSPSATSSTTAGASTPAQMPTTAMATTSAGSSASSHAGSAAVGGQGGMPASTAGAHGAGTGGAAISVSNTMMAWPAISDFGMTGPWKAVTKTSSGPMNAYTLFYPEELGRDGLKHPVITWGNGATSTPDQFTLLPLLASHGFFVIAANDAFVTSDEMKAGIDWALQESDRMGSDFFQKLDATKVAAMGWSLGSLGAFQIAGDPRIVTTVHISGGAMDKSVLPNLHHPAAFFCGDPSDIAHDNCESDFTMATVPVFYGVFPGDHFGIVGSYAPQINKAAAAWLRWRLMGDASLASWFVGADCTLCKDSMWTVKQKMLDTAPP